MLRVYSIMRSRLALSTSLFLVPFRFWKGFDGKCKPSMERYDEAQDHEVDWTHLHFLRKVKRKRTVACFVKIRTIFPELSAIRTRLCVIYLSESKNNSSHKGHMSPHLKIQCPSFPPPTPPPFWDGACDRARGQSDAWASFSGVLGRKPSHSLSFEVAWRHFSLAGNSMCLWHAYVICWGDAAALLSHRSGY